MKKSGGYPSKDERKRLIARFGFSDKKVYNWFHGQRVRERFLFVLGPPPFFDNFPFLFLRLSFSFLSENLPRGNGVWALLWG